MGNLFFIPAHVEACHCGNANSNNQIKDEDGEVEITAVGETALFKEYERETGARDGVRAATKPKEGWQATVREKMRGKQIEQDKARESDQESFEKSFSRGHINLVSM